MINFKEEYKNLYNSIKDIPKRQLEINQTEQREDDCASSIGHKFSNSEL